MAVYNLLEHREVKKLLLDQEANEGFIEKFRVKVPEGKVQTAFAHMPGKEYDVYRVDINGSKLFLVPNEMDDYYRYQPLSESVFESAPKFIGKETPAKDLENKKIEEANRRKLDFQMKCEQSHLEFFNLASQVNSIIPGFFNIPESIDAYKESIGADYSQSQVRYDYTETAKDALSSISAYQQEFGAELPSLDVKALPEHPRLRLSKLKDCLYKSSFEKKHGFSINANIVDKTMLELKALNPNGAVIEQANVSIDNDIAYFDESPEQVQILELFSEDSTFKRYGKNIDIEDSLLASVVAEYEENYFEFSEKMSLPDYDDEGNEILGLRQLQSPSIYRDMLKNNKDVVGKLSLVSKVSLNNTKDYSATGQTVEIR